MKLVYPEYLGDGVYASFDGYHIWLHVGDHRSEPVVALDPEVLAALFRYQAQVVANAEEISTLLKAP